MKVKYLKKHSGHNPGDEGEVKYSVARYLIKVGVLVPVEQEAPEVIEKKLTKKLKSAKKKK